MLTRSRGGSLLDQVGETAHHLALCSGHHRLVDDYGPESGMMIDGSAYRDGTYLVYVGPDAFLTQRYGPGRRASLPALSEMVRSAHAAGRPSEGMWFW